MTRSLFLLYTTTSGHTEHVVDAVMESLAAEAKDLRVVKQRAETAQPAELMKADILVLACGTWNTGGNEGQLNPYMHAFVNGPGARLNFAQKPCSAVGLGDDRYFYTAKAAERLTDYLKTHNGQIILPALKIVNEPYGQEEKIRLWAKELANAIGKLPTDISQ